MTIDSNHFNQLTPAEAERLALLSEELGETVQAIGKILRHGYESTHPDGGPTNRESLERELAGVYAASTLLFDAGDISLPAVERNERKRLVSVRQHLRHNENRS